MPFYVPPNGRVLLLKGVPLDAEHEHSLYFGNATDQANYFSRKAVLTNTAVSYVRKSKGVIKVQAPSDQIYDCNYMMYQNTGFNNKWFYAFITKVEYVSNTVSQITFTIDQLQTWLFDMQLKQCYVEREHTNNDAIGANLVPEGLETGEYIYEDNDYDWCHMFTSYDVVVYTTFGSSWNGSAWVFTDTRGRYMWGIYTGLNIRVFANIENPNTVNSINTFVTQAEQYEQNGIVAMIMIPHEALDQNLDPEQIAHWIPKIYSIDGYVPRNNKLLTSPYVFIEAQNCEGAVAAFPQEYFGGQDQTKCYFMVTFNITCAPCAICVPMNYKGSEYCLTEAIYINNFSQCSYNTDLYKAYMAQSLTARIGQTLVDGVTPVFNGAIGGGVGTVLQDIGQVAKDMWNGLVGDTAETKGGGSALTDLARFGISSEVLGESVGALAVGKLLGGGVASNIYNDLSQMYAKSIQAPHNNGGNTPDYLTSNRLKGFWFFHRTIRSEFAQIIDKYFDRYGYACHRIKVPNMICRENWTYTKTIGCEVEGNIPTEAKTEIKNIFNNGITFWLHPENVGNYSLQNRILG